MTGLFGFLASGAGRVVRALAGIALVIIGLFAIGGAAGYIVTLIGLAPLAAGVFDRCIFAPIARMPFNGKALRAEVAHRRDAV